MNKPDPTWFHDIRSPLYRAKTIAKLLMESEQENPLTGELLAAILEAEEILTKFESETD